MGINARDSFEGGKGVITISTICQSLEGNRFAAITIADNGSGMPPEVKNRIFEPFFTTKGPGKGTGLGLSMAQGIVKQLNGFITCDSIQNFGTTFRISFPLSDTIEPNSPTSVEDLHAESELCLRVLLIDDEPSILHSVSAMLKSIGCDVIVAHGGRDGLGILSERQDFDAIILDLNMPDLTGIEVLQTINQNWPWLKILVSSGYNASLFGTQDHDIFKLTTVLPKPFSVSELVRVLQKI
jgi:CheY-like chemotaxis protein